MGRGGVISISYMPHDSPRHGRGHTGAYDAAVGANNHTGLSHLVIRLTVGEINLHLPRLSRT